VRGKPFGVGEAILSKTLIVTLWILTAVAAVGKYFFEWQGWDALIGLSALMFGVGLIWTLGRSGPALDELPAPDVFTAKRPGFWVRTLLLFLGLALTLLLGMMISPGFSLMLVCGMLGLGVTLTWRKSLTWPIAGVEFGPRAAAFLRH
jgi:hypothetical protein